MKPLRNTLIVVVIGYLIAGTCAAKNLQLSFVRYTAAQLANAQASHQPVVLMFDANWCPPCRVMEQTTFRDPRVVAAAARFLLLEADLSKNGPVSDWLRSQFAVRGIPTILFFDSRGQKVAAVVGGMSADDFLTRLTGTP